MWASIAIGFMDAISQRGDKMTELSLQAYLIEVHYKHSHLDLRSVEAQGSSKIGTTQPAKCEEKSLLGIWSSGKDSLQRKYMFAFVENCNLENFATKTIF